MSYKAFKRLCLRILMQSYSVENSSQVRDEGEEVMHLRVRTDMHVRVMMCM